MDNRKIQVELKSVSKYFTDCVAVDNINLSIRQGEFLTLLGPSGCGKTTTLRMIAGLEAPSEGQIILEGKDVTRIPPYDRNTSIMFQNYALFPHKTVWDNITFGLKMRGLPASVRRKKAEELLDFIQLPDIAMRKPHQLSGGQSQRVAMARSLAIEPGVILLDEPLGALDARLRKSMQIELKAIQKKTGITFIYVTHDQEEALTMSDRIAVMRKGIIEQLDTPLRIYEKPANLFVAGFVGSCNFIEVRTEESVGSGEERFIKVKNPAFKEFTTSPGLQSWSPGEKGAIAVRPEKFVLGEQASELPNQISGEIITEVYAGARYSYIIRISTGDTIICENNRPISRDDGEVIIGWKPEDGIFLKPSDVTNENYCRMADDNE